MPATKPHASHPVRTSASSISRSVNLPSAPAIPRITTQRQDGSHSISINLVRLSIVAHVCFDLKDKEFSLVRTLRSVSAA